MMKVAKGLSITAKMVFAFAILLVVMAGIGLFSVSRMGQVNEVSAELRNRWLPASQLIGDIHAYTSQYRIQQSAHVSATTPEEKAKTEKLLRNARGAIDGMMGDYEPLLATNEQKALFADLKTNWQQYGQLTDQMVGLSNANDPAANDLFNGESLDMFYTVEDSILQLIDLNTKGANALSAKSESIYGEVRKAVIAAMSGGLVIALMLLALLMRTVARPVKLMSVAVKQLVEGDLSVEVPGLSRKDELGSLARALDSFKALFAADQERSRAEAERARETQATIDAIGNGLAALAQGKLTHRVEEDVSGPLGKLYVDYNEAVTHLLNAMSEIVEGCNTIRDGTNEIAQASSDLSHRTEKQAESLAHTSRTLEEFTGSVKIAADNARQTSARLAVARSTAEKVDDTARRAAAAMRNIEASSKEMNDIITTIDGLAFQTNLLALNAGVEAARAGASGAGFAVVATEVRHLAQRSAEAAASIRKLVATSGALITEGVSLVENSGEALRQIVSEVSDVSGLMDEIAEAAEKQASGIAEISAMVNSMDNATQQNAAMVEESTASSRNLSSETNRLVQQLSQFELGQLYGARMAAPAPAAEFAVGFEEEEEGYMAPPVAAPKPRVAGNLAVKMDEDDWTEF